MAMIIGEGGETGPDLRLRDESHLQNLGGRVMKAQTLRLLLLGAGLGLLMAIIILAGAECGEGTLAASTVGETVRVRDSGESTTLDADNQIGFTPVCTIYLPLITIPHYALLFDGLDDYVRIADTGFFDFGSTFSVEVWVKPLSVTAQWDNRGIVTGQTTDVPTLYPRWGMEQGHGTSAYWLFWVCREAGDPICSAPMSALKLGVWQHLAGTYDGSRIWTYQDGEFVGSVPLPGNVKDVNFLYLGRSEMSFHGVIDEVRIWNITRSQADIQADMHRTLRGDEPGLVGYWWLDEGSGQVVSDATGKNSDGWLGSTPSSGGDDPSWVVSDAPVW
jgi:hypothetical protein